MSSTSKSAAQAAPTPAPKAPLPTAERKSKQAPTLSHDRIAADIAAFRKAGGKVEVLGNTPLQRKAGPATGAAAAARPAAAAATAAPARTRR